VTDAADVRAALERLAEPAPHLRWRLAVAGEPLGDDDLACGDLAVDADALAAAVAASAAGRGSDDPHVLGSLWWQAYAYRVAGTALACWLLSGVAPDVRAEATAVGIARSRPSSVVYLAPSADHLATFVDRLFAGHLDRVAESLRARHALGRSLLWGNVSAACASAAGAVRTVAGPGWLDQLGAFLAAAPHDLARLGRWTFPPDAAAVPTATSDGPTYRRTTCCLWWRTSAAAGALCADCSLARSPIETSPA